MASVRVCPGCGKRETGAFGKFLRADAVGGGRVRTFTVEVHCAACDGYFDTGRSFSVSP